MMNETFCILKGRKALSQKRYALNVRLGIIPAHTMSHAPRGIVQSKSTRPSPNFEWSKPVEDGEITESELSELLNWARCEHDRWRAIPGAEVNNEMALAMVHQIEDELQKRQKT